MNAMVPPEQTHPPQDKPFDQAREVAVVVINWNGWRHTLECLEALRQVQSPGWHLFIVDNASTDDSVEHLSGLGEDVTLIESPINGGWTGGNNLGIRHAMELGYAFFFILNNDAIVFPDTLAVLERTFQEHASEMPILGPVQVGVTGEEFDFIGAAVNEYTGMPYALRGSEAEQRPLTPMYETSFICGAGIFAHRSHFESVDLFDEAFYLNYDETDWSFRAHKAGFRSYMVRDAVIRHEGSASIGGSSSPLNRYFLTRNALLFSERHCTLRQRYRLWRDFYRRARDLVGGKGYLGWLPRFYRSKDRLVIAFRTAIGDYVLRRFGDCPALIRELNRAG